MLIVEGTLRNEDVLCVLGDVVGNRVGHGPCLEGASQAS
jgi:hypothetical protein